LLHAPRLDAELSNLLEIYDTLPYPRPRWETEAVCHFAPFKWREVVIIRYVSVGRVRNKIYRKAFFKAFNFTEAKVGKKVPFYKAINNKRGST
jgi:hypothetical protein